MEPKIFGQYLVFSDGRIRGPRRMLKPRVKRNGYAEVNISEDGSAKSLKVHSIVALVHIGERPHGMTIDHRDGNKLNNAVGNLEYVTLSENQRRAYDVGYGRTPRWNRRVKVTIGQCQVAKAMHESGLFTQIEAANIIGVTTWSAVTYRLRNGK